jgi:hypothetical protein
MAHPGWVEPQANGMPATAQEVCHCTLQIFISFALLLAREAHFEHIPGLPGAEMEMGVSVSFFFNYLRSEADWMRVYRPCTGDASAYSWNP